MENSDLQCLRNLILEHVGTSRYEQRSARTCNKNSSAGAPETQNVRSVEDDNKRVWKFNKMERLDSRGAIYRDCDSQNEQ